MKKKNYLLFIYGDLGTNEDFMHFVNSVFAPLTDEIVKYIKDKTSSVCHFTSGEPLEELSEFFNYIFDEKIYSFFLMEKPDKIGVRLHSDLEEHLFNLLSTTGYTDINKHEQRFEDYNKTIEEVDEGFMQWANKQMEDLNYEGDEFFDDDFDEIKRIRSKHKEPLRMDAILDKVSEKGFNSLTTEEKKFLKNLSNNTQ